MRKSLQLALAAAAGLWWFGSIAPAQTPGPNTQIPDGYLPIQAPPDWRGQTTDWYLEQAKEIYQQITSTSGSLPTGVAIVDRDTGEIIATFTSDQLQAPTQ